MADERYNFTLPKLIHTLYKGRYYIQPGLVFSVTNRCLQ